MKTPQFINEKQETLQLSQPKVKIMMIDKDRIYIKKDYKGICIKEKLTYSGSRTYTYQYL
jgi:hypothetical protein